MGTLDAGSGRDGVDGIRAQGSRGSGHRLCTHPLSADNDEARRPAIASSTKDGLARRQRRLLKNKQRDDVRRKTPSVQDAVLQGWLQCAMHSVRQLPAEAFVVSTAMRDLASAKSAVWFDAIRKPPETTRVDKASCYLWVRAGQGAVEKRCGLRRDRGRAATGVALAHEARRVPASATAVPSDQQ